MSVRRRDFVLGAALAGGSGSLPRIVVSVRVLFDRGAHSGQGLTHAEILKFEGCREKARREYAVSGIAFELEYVEGAFLREQGYSRIPDRFLTQSAINLFVTETLGYDIDRDRTGGASMGPRPPGSRREGDGCYRIFLGLKDASETTLEHEYAHHLCLDTKRNPTAAANFWADLRVDFLLWRQRRGAVVEAFRNCAAAEWARVEPVSGALKA